MPLPRYLIALLVALALPAPAHAAANLELGVQDDAVLHDRFYSDAALALDRAADLGADRIRVNLIWAQSMPHEQATARRSPETVSWDFSRLERLYSDALARGMRLQVTLTGEAPRWATSNRKVGAKNPSPRLFAQFASAAVAQFAGRIDRWSIWNEPNWHSRLYPARKAPARYRALYARGHAAIKALDPAADVLIGELAPGTSSRRSTPGLEFLRRMACVNRAYRSTRRCPRLVADGLALHPYNFARRPGAARSRDRDIVEMGSLSRATTALDRLARAGRLRTPSGARMPLYLTEFGYFTKGALALKSRQHAKWMRQAWKIAARNPRVRQLLQYGLIDPWPKQVTWRMAVMKRDGTPRPVYRTLRKLAR